MQAQELETAHGGIYSLLNEELLLPLARLTLESIDVKLENTNFEPVILTGLDAMGRATVNDNIMTLFQQLGMLKEVPEALQAELDPLRLLTLLSEGLDIDATKITPTKAEKQARINAQNKANKDAMQSEAAAKGMGQQIGQASPDVAMAMAQQMDAYGE